MTNEDPINSEREQMAVSMWRRRVGLALGHREGLIPDWDVLVPQIQSMFDNERARLNEIPVAADDEIEGGAEVARENAVRGMKYDLYRAINGPIDPATVDNVNWGDLIKTVEEWATTLSPNNIRRDIAIALGNEPQFPIPPWHELRQQAERLVETINSGLGKWIGELRVALKLPADARTTWGELIREVRDIQSIPRTDHSHVDCNASFNELRRRSERLIERSMFNGALDTESTEWVEARNNWRRRYGVEGPVLGDKHPKPRVNTPMHEAVEHIQSTLKYIHVRTGSGINLPNPTVNIHQGTRFELNGTEHSMRLTVFDDESAIAVYQAGHWDTVMMSPIGADVYAVCGCHDPADKEMTSTVDGFGRHPWENPAQDESDPVPSGLAADIQSAIADADTLPKDTKACKCGWRVIHGSAFDRPERVWANENCPVHMGR
jgi:hypothetical protein